MDEDDTVAQDEQKLEDLDQEIKTARQHLDEMFDVNKPEFYEDDETPHEKPSDVAPGELPG